MLVHQITDHVDSDQIAFLGVQNITYGVLQQKVNRLRNFLYQQGVRPGQNVGLLSKNSIDYIYCYLAIVSLEAVVVPINFQLVPREIAYIIQDANIKVLITMSELKLDVELTSYHYKEALSQLIIAEFTKIILELDLTPAPVSTTFDKNTLCTIIYTSGTTGRPKGAMLSHHNLVSDAQAFSLACPHTITDRVLCILPMYHCFAWTVAVLTPLLNGCSIKILESFNIRETITTIREHSLTIIPGIPTMFRLFTQWATEEDLAHVRLFISGGSSLPQEISEQFTQKTGKKVVEGYGLSEASPVVSLNPVDDIKLCSIGKPLPGIDVRIIDNHDIDLPPGQIGELLVRGPNVMIGYYNLPEESTRALQNGWLHTGDLAYIDQDGYIFIVDRLKDMIITSGENIYPREIEELLYTYPDVDEAAVIGVPDKLRGTTVRAYIVPTEGSLLNKKSLQTYLQNKIAPYKIPREFIIVSSLPKSSTGKILKKELRQQVNGEG